MIKKKTVSFEKDLRKKYGKKYETVFSDEIKECIKGVDRCREILDPLNVDLSEKIILARNGKW